MIKLQSRSLSQHVASLRPRHSFEQEGCEYGINERHNRHTRLRTCVLKASPIHVLQLAIHCKRWRSVPEYRPFYSAPYLAPFCCSQAFESAKEAAPWPGSGPQKIDKRLLDWIEPAAASLNVNTLMSGGEQDPVSHVKILWLLLLGLCLEVCIALFTKAFFRREVASQENGLSGLSAIDSSCFGFSANSAKSGR